MVRCCPAEHTVAPHCALLSLTIIMKVAGNTFFITGGASGLGYAVAELLVRQGGNVILADLNAESGAQAVQKLGAKHALFQTVDVTDADSVQKALDAGVAKFGGLHGVVNCAGVGFPKKILSGRGTVHDMKAFDFVVKVNLYGTFNVIRLATAVMAKQTPNNDDGERGVIINTASVAAFEGQIGQASYSASKGAVVAMTLPIARELSKRGIRCNTVAPGIFDTPMMAKLPDKARASLGQQVPFPTRMGNPAEFAEMCHSIITNPYVNGTVIRIDGSLRMSSL